MLVGVFASALVQERLRGEAINRWIPRRHLPAVLLSSLLGLVAPVCDCGAIPLGRRLIARGVPVYVAVSFVLAAPVVNPITIFATAVAFQGSIGIVILRVGMTLSVAILIGLLVARLAGLARLGGSTSEPLRPVPITSLVTTEYFDIIFFVVLGALFTAASQTLVPRADLLSLGSQRSASVLTLMPVASLLSICSEADAFVARAFASTFSVGAVLSFMTIGQIVDVRNGLLLWRALGGRLLLLVICTAYPLIFVEGILINRVMNGI